MLLTVDIGNSNIKMGIYHEDEMTDTWRVNTIKHRTITDFLMLFERLFEVNDIKEKIKEVVLASVVPAITDNFIEAIRQYFSIQPQLISTSMDTGINIKYENPSSLGVDRFVNAVSTYELYGGTTIVIDTGTAVKVDVISAEGDFMGGMICPGMAISFEEMLKRTELLPKIPLSEGTVNVLGQSTSEEMQAGVLYGYVGIVEGLIKKAKQQFSHDKVKVVGTGGLLEFIAKYTTEVDIINKSLTLDGLMILHKRIKNQSS